MGNPFDGAADVIVTKKNRLFRSSGFYLHENKSSHSRDHKSAVKMDIDGINSKETLRLSIPMHRLLEKDRNGVPTYTPEPADLKLMYEKLNEGPNEISFYLENEPERPIFARIYRYDWSSALILMDVDGTITASEKTAMLFCFMGIYWMRKGIADLLCCLENNGYKVIYVIQRPISLKDSTRRIVRDFEDKDGKKLPDGPVINSCHGRGHTFLRHVKLTPHDAFKTPCLQQIKGPFCEQAFYAGFGDRKTDATSYLAVGIPEDCVFRIQMNGAVQVCKDGKKEIEFVSYEPLAGFINKFRDQTASASHA